MSRIVKQSLKFCVKSLSKTLSLDTKPTVGLLVFWCFLWLSLSWLIAPRFDFFQQEYQAGDIATQNIRSSQEILIEDKLATESNRKKRLEAMRFVFDFDPSAQTKVINSVRMAFLEARKIMQENRLQQEKSEQVLRERSLARLELQEEIASLRGREQFLHSLIAAQEAHLAAQKEDEAAKNTKNTEEEQSIAQQLDFHRWLRDQVSTRLQAKLEQATIQQVKPQQADRQLWQQEQQNADLLVQQGIMSREVITQFLSVLQIELPDQDRLFHAQFLKQSNEEVLVDLLSAFAGVLIQQAPNSSYNRQHSADIINLSSEEIIKLDNLTEMLDITQARKQVFDVLNTTYSESIAAQDLLLLGQLAQRLIAVSVTLNQRETERVREEIINSTEKAYILVKAGEMLAREGDRISERQALFINNYYQGTGPVSKIPRFLLIALGIAGICYLVYRLRAVFGLRIVEFSMLFSVCLVTLAGLHFSKFLVDNIALIPPKNSENIAYFAAPLSLAPILCLLLMGRLKALLAIVILLVAISLMSGSAELLSIYFCLIGFFALVLRNYSSSRMGLLKNGIWIALSSMTFAVCITILTNDFSWSIELFFAAVAGLLGALLAAVLAMFLLPIFEYLFEITTDLKLLELSNLNQPALKNLSIQAPGSYQHSIMVGNLAEAGALAIDAKALLCRVAAYYHDIGKSVHPHYFVENFAQNEYNIHDRIDDPYRSAQYILKHISEGIALAEKYELGRTLINIIKEHHGNNRIHFFYYKALEKATDPAEVDPALFTYCWGKPSTKESAIIMIADVCEASTKSISAPDAQAIEEMVDKVTQDLLLSDQFEHSGLTLGEFKRVVAAIKDTLMASYHVRITYPDADKLADLSTNPTPA